MTDHTHQTYLGDAVYASFDGFQIWLAVNHHENYCVALDPNVIKRLAIYAAELGLLKDQGA